MLNVDLVGAAKFNIQHSTFQLNLSFEDEGGRSRHIDMVVCLAVFYFQRSAIHYDTALSTGTLGQGCGYSCGTGSCTTSHRDTASPFPNSCPYNVSVCNLCELDVASLRKGFVSF